MRMHRPTLDDIGCCEALRSEQNTGGVAYYTMPFVKGESLRSTSPRRARCRSPSVSHAVGCVVEERQVPSAGHDRPSHERAGRFDHHSAQSLSGARMLPKPK